MTPKNQTMMNIRRPNLQELPSTRQLVLSTIAATIVFAIIFVTVVLPAEIGVDVTGVGERLHLTRMGQIKSAMSEKDAPIEGRPVRQDEITLTLGQGQGMEVKLEMKKGYVVQYHWAVTGGAVTHDTHGDPYINKHIYVTYTQADNVRSDSGSIEAVYSGFHGWYWKNNGTKLVTITLKTKGEYLELIPM